MSARQVSINSLITLLLILMAASVPGWSQTDPGARAGAAGAGGAISGLTTKESKYFSAGLDAFNETSSVTGSIAGTEPGLGPRFNLDSCAGCHKHPAVGGSSPPANPQVNAALSSTAQVAYVTTTVPILSPNGPVREVRFAGDGGVHDLFVVTGRGDAPAGCSITQPNFVAAAAPVFPGNLRFRIPTPTFGLGLIEAIEDASILANVYSGKPFGIQGKVNRNGNDGTVTRFGWKAQNKSLVIFAGEAYNVEQGITNELFPDERGEAGIPDPAPCRAGVTSLQDAVHYDQTQPQTVPDDANSFANFMRFLAPPAQVSSYASVTSTQIAAGEVAFNKAGCNVCHLKSMTTGNHLNVALRNKTVNLFSDLLVHDVGTGDGIAQGAAGGSEFRTAPLWGVGQRLFFMHDGRSNNLVDAINQHASEAAQVIQNFQGVSTLNPASNLSEVERQNLLNFLRSL